MSLNIWLNVKLFDQHGRYFEDKQVFDTNITHNLGKMAKEASLYQVMWRPEEIDIDHARQAQPYLIQGIIKLVERQDEMIELNPENGWGTYDNLLDVALDYLNACLRYPEAKIGISR
jgi:hypothetical protein